MTNQVGVTVGQKKYTKICNTRSQNKNEEKHAVIFFF